MDMGLKTPALYSVYCDYFYPVVMQENRDLAKQMMAFGDKFGGQLEKTDDQKQMALFGIDALFIIGDYEGALQAAAENKKYWPKDWLDSTRAKIGAHLALEKKNYSEAVEGFRKYMVYIAENKVGSYNPINEQIYTPDMLLGFNAMRIGNILRDNLKDEPGARKAYDEAEKYFKKAAKDVRPDTKEAKYIEEQMALLDARKKQ
jgi:tetratricopeptide (TPR) repeat protein